MSEPLRLHIGGRERREGWTVFNIEPGPHVDHVGDCRDLIPTGINQNPWAHFRRPIDMIFQG